jgi:hypothetical protein
MSKTIDIIESINLTILNESSPKNGYPLATESIIYWRSENVPPVRSRTMFSIDHPSVLFLL